ncbi:serine/threonine protein kinase (plasmid) [Paracoccus sp. TK19116]|uniref:Serine/threonine protein kinase n=1 Tax=Paracoccus albicereus TaxID=2922394 RepID=A0ABT1MMS5_9RHOB|nr:serine/threonine-protein kinase [Paracoccus albicereus]MCQ0969399.1 serine/threonine protein kinase [Paracoccus albicereus]
MTRPPVEDDDDRTRLVPSPQHDAASQVDDRTRIATRPAEPAPQPVTTGSLINNNYRVRAMLSQGGMGEVYRAENIFTGDPVAVKIVLPTLARDEGIIALFKREARILGQLNDDALVRYHNFVLDDGLGRYCLIMEFIDGTTLWDHVDVNGPLRAQDALRLMARLARGLEKAHARGVIHRDLSPDNVMLRQDKIDDPVIIDFGIARAADMSEGQLAGRFAGKYKYVSPEQIGHFGGEVGPRADIYGMALMIAAVLRGDPLPMGGSAEEAAAARRGLPNLSGLPHEVYPLLQYMLQPDPAMRPHDMGEVADMALDPTRIPLAFRHPLWGETSAAPIRGGGGSLPSLTGAPREPLRPVAREGTIDAPEPRRKNRRRTLAATGAVAALAFGGLVVLNLKPDAPPQTTTPIAQDQQATTLPGRDIETEAGFLAGFDLGPCTLVQRSVTGLATPTLSVLSNRDVETDGLAKAFAERFGAAPDITTGRIAAGQCAALDFVRTLQGRAEAPPILSLDSDRMTAGGAIAGRLREARGRPLWLFLVEPGGGIHDLSSRAIAQADGSFVFSFGMAEQVTDGPSPQLIIALTSREPLIAPAVAASGAPANELLSRVLNEITAAGGYASADIAMFTLEATS